MQDQFDAPDGWHFGAGSRSESYYSHWLYTDKMLYEDGEFGGEIHVYWDKGGDHHVEWVQYTKIRQDGDPEYDYSEKIGSYVSEEEAMAAAIEAAADIR